MPPRAPEPTGRHDLPSGGEPYGSTSHGDGSSPGRSPCREPGPRAGGDVRRARGRRRPPEATPFLPADLVTGGEATYVDDCPVTSCGPGLPTGRPPPGGAPPFPARAARAGVLRSSFGCAAMEEARTRTVSSRGGGAAVNTLIRR
ncbi:hypothetical protein GCM10010275_18040 [Streptomyces litmocidini]|nr:hypothetical protein GCM10010275_18040 [Streptomyces litmocidini]